MVWLLSDANHMLQTEVSHSIHVAYAMKGYSLHMKKMRSKMDNARQACHEEGVHVACTYFDGQFLTLATTDAAANLLTLIQ